MLRHYGWVHIGLPAPWFDHERHTVAGHRLALKEWQVLEILWRRSDKVVSPDTLMTLLYSDQPGHPAYLCGL